MKNLRNPFYHLPRLVNKLRILNVSWVKTDSYSNSIAGEIVKDLQMATHYPPEIVDMPTAEELAQSIDVLVSNIFTIKSKQGGGGEDDTSFLD